MFCLQNFENFYLIDDMLIAVKRPCQLLTGSYFRKFDISKANLHRRSHSPLGV